MNDFETENKLFHLSCNDWDMLENGIQSLSLKIEESRKLLSEV